MYATIAQLQLSSNIVSIVMGLSARLRWLILLYGIQGIPYGFQVTFLPVLLHSSGTSLTKVSLMRALNIPWMLKLLWAPFVTSSQSIKRPLTFSLAGLSIIFATTSFIPLQSLRLLSVSLLLINALVAIQDIAVDTFAIQSLSYSELGTGNAIQVVAYKLGAMLGGGVLTLASQYLPWSALITSITCVYFCVALVIHLELPIEHMSNEVSKTFCQNDKTEQTRERASKGKPSPRTLQVPRVDGDDASSSSPGVVGHAYNLRSLNKRQVDSPGQLDCSIMSHNFESDKNGPTATPEEERTLFNSKETSESASSSHHNRGAFDGDISTKETLMKRNILQNIFEDFADVFQVRNTKWLLFYLLIYKLGEQGAVSIFPLYLLDEGVSTNQIAVWTGVISQWISIGGSLMGGWMINRLNQKRRFTVQLCWLSLWRSLSLVLMSVLIHALDPGHNSNHIVLCLPLYIVQLVGGAITTATFTLMMTTSQGAHHPSTQTLHHTTVATIEVLGKVFFTTCAGLLVDQTGYICGFYCFTLLSVLPILPLLKIKS